MSRGTSILPTQPTGAYTASARLVIFFRFAQRKKANLISHRDKKGGFAIQCDKNDYRGILAGLEGIPGKKAVDSEAMTVKN